jgi:hypothetical protein
MQAHGFQMRSKLDARFASEIPDRGFRQGIVRVTRYPAAVPRFRLFEAVGNDQITRHADDHSLGIDCALWIAGLNHNADRNGCGIGGLAPSHRSDLARLGLKAVLGGSLATFMTATIAGVLSLL